MIVPQFWAEGRRQHRERGRQITVRRFGWSDTSQDDAQVNANQRAGDALRQLVCGEKLPRYEPKLAYNGAEGVPIREEIVDRQGDTIITRNLYGARCLNTPNILFADIDFHKEVSFRFGCTVFVALLSFAAVIIANVHGKRPDIAVLVPVFFVIAFLSPFLAYALHRVIFAVRGGAERIAWRRLRRFAKRHPDWSLRVYRTPAGLRVLVTHRPFQSDEPAVINCFRELHVDELYRRMCFKQKCFRARVSAKPWRIGIKDHLKPRPGHWPIKPERLPARQAWIERYEKAAASYAACALAEMFGVGTVDLAVRPVLELHDSLCRAATGLPLA